MRWVALVAGISLPTNRKKWDGEQRSASIPGNSCPTIEPNEISLASRTMRLA